MKRTLFLCLCACQACLVRSEGLDAAAFGFSSDATPAANAAALQKALDGGKKKVTVTRPGVYRLDRTIYLDDDTTLECARGVVLSKAVPYANVLANRGAFFGGRNRNITIRGANIAANGFERVPPNTSRAAGLRGLIGFYDIENLKLFDTVINDFGRSQYAIQIVGFDGLLIDGFELRGNKDGIHLNCGRNFVIRNGKLRTYDDGIAINAGEWPGGCTPRMGSITDGLVENIEDEPGGHCNFARVITGAWMEWRKGMRLQYRDIFTIGRDVYSVYPGKVSTNETVSLTPPRHKQGVWKSPEGINFFHLQSDGCRRADIRRVTFRNIRMNCPRAISCSWELGAWARLVHPDLPRADYPVIDIRLEHVEKTVPGPIVTGNADAHVVFEKCRAKGPLASMGWSKNMTQCPVRRITVDGATTVSTNGSVHLVAPAAAPKPVVSPAAAPKPVVSRPRPRPVLRRRIASGIERYGIVHWGLNTFTDREWGFGDENPQDLNPTRFDADQIVGACRDGGLQGLIVVAKHHDGFCLWPTETTAHNISKSPFRGGKGNYVKEMEQACRRHGLAFGVYVSPWDRNNAHYGTERYVTDVFQRQIGELLSGAYGEIFEMWFDGANGGDGYYGGAREKRKIPAGYYRYDTETFAKVRQWQPNACIFNEKDLADFRFGGNERGDVDPDSRSTGGHYTGEWKEYRKWSNTGLVNGATFHPVEADFPLRPGWFYHAKDKGKTKRPAYLMQRYLAACGNAATLNIGIAPNKEGCLDDEDVRALKGFGELRKIFFARPVADGAPFNVVVMREDVSDGERVDRWKLVADGKTLLSGRSIGIKRIRVLEKPVTAASCRIEATSETGRVGAIVLRRYCVDPALVAAVRAATSASGETDVFAKWLKAKDAGK